MKIIHVTHEIPPYEAYGTGVYTQNLARAQARSHEVLVFARHYDSARPRHDIFDERHGDLRIRFVNIPELNWTPLADTYVDPTAAEIFGRFLDEERPDIVHIEHLVGFGITLIDEARTRGIPVVMTLHDFWAMCPMGQRRSYFDGSLCHEIDLRRCGPCCHGTGWTFPDEEGALRHDAELSSGGAGSVPFRMRYERIVADTPGRVGRRPRALARAAWECTKDLFQPRQNGDAPAARLHPFAERLEAMRRALHAVDCLFAPSRFLWQSYIDIFGLDPSQIVYTRYGMDLSYVEITERVPSNVLRFGFVGSIIPTKGVKTLVEAFLRIADRFPATRLDIRGSANRWMQWYEDEVRAMAAPCDRIRFLGRFDNRRIGQVLAEVDLLVVPSIWFENSPLTLSEAAITRTPVLTSDLGGMKEFVEIFRYGATFRTGDAASLAEAMARAASDPSELARLSSDGYVNKTAEEDAAEKIAAYEEILASRRTTVLCGGVRRPAV